VTPLLALLAGGAVTAVGTAAAVHALFVAPHDLRITRVDVPVRGLGEAFDGYTIVALADLHHWPTSSLRAIDRAVNAANAERPDAIVLLGDYSVSMRTVRGANRALYEPALRAMTPSLSRLAAPDGVYAVLGNHDHYFDAGAVTRWLATTGARPLVNACATVRRGGDALVICGVDDALFGRIDLDAASADAPDAPTVVLSHNPDGVLLLGDRRRVDLVLAGHTHGGQFVFPVVGALATHARVCTRAAASGWVPNERAPLYVSRGVGVQMPGRVGSPPEVVVVVLRTARSEK
jgi:uncharacterized protein